jgi:hypothetical protein
MSLIYQALRHMQAQDAPPPALAPRPPLPRMRRYLPWVLGLGLPLGVVASLASAWALAPDVPAGAVAASAVTTALPEQAAAPATALQAPAAKAAPAPAPAPAPAAMPAEAASDVHTATKRGVTIVDTPAPPALPAGALVRHERQGKPGKDDDAQVRQAIVRLDAAIREGRYTDARHDLDYVSTRLPPDSLTLLRMRAWYAAQSGNGDVESLYRSILARLPDDQNANVNLALIRARAGDYTNARELLDKAKSRDPDSPVVRDALNTVESMQP